MAYGSYHGPSSGLSGSFSVVGTAHVTGTVNLSEPITGSVAVVADPAEYAEDSAFTDGSIGMMILEVRRDACTSSAGSDGDRAVKNQDGDGYSYSRDKSYDAGSNALRSLPVTDLSARRVDAFPLISSAQTLSTSYLDLGPEVACVGYNALALWLTLDINSSSNARVRCLAKHTSAGAGEYSFLVSAVDTSGTPYNVKVQPEYVEFDTDVDQSAIMLYDLKNCVPYVQFQVQAETTGSSIGQITDAYVTLGYA